MNFDTNFIIRTTGASLSGASVPVLLSGAEIDSRRCQKGMLFVCLPGEKVDGHDFASAAVDNGASAILASRNPFSDSPPVPVLLVHDPAEALRKLAAACRAQFNGTVIGLTGTAGKTSTREILSTVLEEAGRVSRTAGNFNNELGLPLSILNADQDANWWVIEVGISHPGDMDQLGSILQPDVGLILNAGPGHTEGLGEKGTAFHKAALFKYVHREGIALASADYPQLVQETSALRPDTVFFSTTGKHVPYCGTYLGMDANGLGRYRIQLGECSIEAHTTFSGAYAAENVTAAAAAAHKLGLAPDAIVQGLAQAKLPAQRFTKLSAHGWLVFDDSYNANPLSMQRMLFAAAEIADSKPLVCVLGAMGELGTIAAEEHEKLGQILAHIQPAAIFWVGPHFENVKAGLADNHFSGSLFFMDDPEKFLPAFSAMHFNENGVLLFKGSRFNKLERYLAAFKG